MLFGNLRSFEHTVMTHSSQLLMQHGSCIALLKPAASATMTHANSPLSAYASLQVHGLLPDISPIHARPRARPGSSAASPSQGVCQRLKDKPPLCPQRQGAAPQSSAPCSPDAWNTGDDGVTRMLVHAGSWKGLSPGSRTKAQAHTQHAGQPTASKPPRRGSLTRGGTSAGGARELPAPVPG